MIAPNPKHVIALALALMVLVPQVASHGIVTYPPPTDDDDSRTNQCRNPIADEIVRSSWRAGDTIDVMYDITIPHGGNATWFIDYNGGTNFNEVFIAQHTVANSRGERAISVNLDGRTCVPPNACQLRWDWQGNDGLYRNCMEVAIYPQNTDALPFRVPCDFEFGDLLEQEDLNAGDEFVVICEGCANNVRQQQVLGCPTGLVSPASNVCLAAMLATGDTSGNVETRVAVDAGQASYSSCTVAGVTTATDGRQDLSLSFPDATPETTTTRATTTTQLTTTTRATTATTATQTQPGNTQTLPPPPTQTSQTTTTQTRPVQTTTSQTTPVVTQPGAEEDMVLRFNLRTRYDSITDFDALEARLKVQLEQIYGFPPERTSVEFAPNGRRTVAIVTVRGAQSADEPTALSLAQSLMTGDGSGLDEMEADDFECVANCGTYNTGANNVEGTGGASIGLLVGVAVGLIAVLLAIGAGVFMCMKKRKEKAYLNNMANENQMAVNGSTLYAA